jgi:CO/xanthine dehydrogenase FAD-binding subunit
MITEYHRPQTMEKALELLSMPYTYPLGGGTVLTLPRDETFAVVDLQALGLNKLHKSGDKLEIGATATLQDLLNNSHSPVALRSAIRLEAPLNIRNMATVAGALVTCDGRSPFAVVMQALDAKITIMNGGKALVDLGDMLILKHETLLGKLILKIEFPLLCKLAFKSVARSPADRPIICAALGMWPSGRTRLVLGGWGDIPTLAMDGNDSSGILAASKDASQNSTDAWGSSEYRSSVAAVLAKRCIEELNPQSSSSS